MGMRSSRYRDAGTRAMAPQGSATLLQPAWNVCAHGMCGQVEQVLTSGGFPLPLSMECVERNEDEPPAELDTMVHLACLHTAGALAGVHHIAWPHRLSCERSFADELLMKLRNSKVACSACLGHPCAD